MRRILAILTLAFFVAPVAQAEARSLALVIGNDSYANVPWLKKAVNDARAVATQLESLGFVVREAENLDQRAMSRALVAFAQDLHPATALSSTMPATASRSAG
jgi:hypothetical protein